MSSGIRGFGTFVVAGILLAVLVIGGMAAGGITFPSIRFPNFPKVPGFPSFPGTGSFANDGTLTILLTDAPVQLKELNVTIDKVQVHMEGGGNETWTTLPFVGDVSQVSVNLLTLQNVTKDLSVGQVSAGNYTMIRLGIVSASVTYADGTTEAVRVPSGNINIIVHFEVKAGGTTKVLIDMTSDFVAISHSGNLRPVLKATAKVLSS